MSDFFSVLGLLWVVTFVVVINIAWAMRNRSKRARHLVDFAKRFTAQRQDYAILVWAIVGDALLLILLFAYYLRASS